LVAPDDTVALSSFVKGYIHFMEESSIEKALEKIPHFEDMLEA